MPGFCTMELAVSWLSALNFGELGKVTSFRWFYFSVLGVCLAPSQSVALGFSLCPFSAYGCSFFFFSFFILGLCR
jgi:hypothetical protein